MLKMYADIKLSGRDKSIHYLCHKLFNEEIFLLFSPLPEVMRKIKIRICNEELFTNTIYSCTWNIHDLAVPRD